jgi:putative aminopeptidase FrvX
MGNSIKSDVLKAINKDDVTKLCQESVRIPGFSGEERPVAQLLGARLESSGLLTKTDKSGNLIAILKEGKTRSKASVKRAHGRCSNREKGTLGA